MDARDRQAIDDIFQRLEDVERQGAPRDAEAEALITDRVRARPAYAYYLAQTVVAQNQALEQAQAQLDARGAAGPREDGGFLSRMFGGGDRPAVPVSPRRDPRDDPRYGRRGGMGGGGFLARAAQTAVGVAGGVILGNMLMNAFDGGGEAQAAETDAGAAEQTGGSEDVGVEADASAGDADVGGDFDVGGFEF